MCQKKRDVLSAEPDIFARIAFIAISGNTKAIILNVYIERRYHLGYKSLFLSHRLNISLRHDASNIRNVHIKYAHYTQ